jgi:hypothetical protein
VGTAREKNKMAGRNFLKKLMSTLHHRWERIVAPLTTLMLTEKAFVLPFPT